MKNTYHPKRLMPLKSTEKERRTSTASCWTTGNADVERKITERCRSRDGCSEGARGLSKGKKHHPEHHVRFLKRILAMVPT